MLLLHFDDEAARFHDALVARDLLVEDLCLGTSEPGPDVERFAAALRRGGAMRSSLSAAPSMASRTVAA